jgi:hypothetical protein
MKTYLIAICAGAAMMLGGCAASIEATRPLPTDLGELAAEHPPRSEIVNRFGPPIDVASEQGQSCDVYQLWVHGYKTRSAKVALATGEVFADVLPFDEVPMLVSEVNRNHEDHRIVHMCYASDGRLQHITELPPNTELPSPKLETASAGEQVSSR